MERKDFFKGAMLGVVTGAMAGILFAPKSGEETREDLKNTFEEIKGKVTDKLTQLEEFTKENYNKIVSEVVGTYKEARKLTEEEAKQIGEILENSYAQIEEVIKKNSSSEESEKK